MSLPNIWGAGQLFAFSALDGNAFATNDFAGMLSGDKIGIRFYTKVIRELAIVNIHAKDLQFQVVSGDYICAETDTGESIKMYYDTNLITGQLPLGALAVVLVEGQVTIIEEDSLKIQDTEDGEFTVLAVRGKRFAFAYGSEKEKTKKRALMGLDVDVDAEASKRLVFLENNINKDVGPYCKLYGKCLSVMKTQLYSPEGKCESIT